MPVVGRCGACGESSPGLRFRSGRTGLNAFDASALDPDHVLLRDEDAGHDARDRHDGITLPPWITNGRLKLVIRCKPWALGSPPSEGSARMNPIPEPNRASNLVARGNNPLDAGRRDSTV